jgi:hypothetical protein
MTPPVEHRRFTSKPRGQKLWSVLALLVARGELSSSGSIKRFYNVKYGRTHKPSGALCKYNWRGKTGSRASDCRVYFCRGDPLTCYGGTERSVSDVSADFTRMRFCPFEQKLTMPMTDRSHRMASSRPARFGERVRLSLSRAAIAIMLISAISACTSFDPLDSTGESFNRNTTDYSNDAILLNIVRSSLYEPLSFITITSISGLSSATGTLGFAGFTLGPAKPPVTFILGPNSAARTNTNTANVNVVDDPASWVALLAPVNPATIAFFINQGYPRELLFFLFTDRLRKLKKDTNGKFTEDGAESFF